jgi:uncharacterized membrane protein YgcG
MLQRTWLAVLVLLCLSVVSLGAASGYSIENLHSDITITEEGHYDVQEQISMYFHEPLHGFYRVLPTYYDITDGSRDDVYARVSRIKASDTLQVTHGSTYVEIRLGSADRTVRGLQNYAISYRYDIGQDPYEEYDEFYYNIVGEYWEQPIEQFSFSLQFPAPLEGEMISFSRGFRGSTDAQGVSWKLSPDRMQITGETTTLEPGEALTIRVQMPDGYFVERTDWQGRFQIVLLILSALLIPAAWFTWNRYGKDKDLIIVPNHEPPEGMSPLDVGYIIDESLDPRDVTSMIFYWADKGCLTIVEEGKSFSFIRGKDPVDASSYELQLFKAFFAAGSGGVVREKDLKGSFFKAYQKLKTQVDAYYRGDRALASVKSRNKAVLIVLSMLIPAVGYALALSANYVGMSTGVLFALATGEGILLVVLWHLLFRTWHIRKIVGKLFKFLLIFLVCIVGWAALMIGGLFIVGNTMDAVLITATVTTVTQVVLSFFAVITRQRSEYGRRVLEQVLGLREFIERVEIDELKRMIDKDPNYYYRILSFAIVLGLENKWAKKFDSITIEPPSWYAGPHTMVHALAVSSMLSRCNNALTGSIAAPANGAKGGHFGGSSFGGGGFSGGGFGGGGGGAW